MRPSDTRRRTLRATGLCLAALAAALLAPSGDRPDPAAARRADRVTAAAPAAPRRAGNRVAVVVDTGEGAPRTACVRFATDSITGLQALQMAGMDPVVNTFGGQGAAVCALCGKGCAAGSSCLTCQAPDYWAYFHNGSYSRAGAGSVSLRDGDVQGWRWGTGEPPAGMSFATICGVEVPPTAPPTAPPPPPPPTAPPPPAPTAAPPAPGSPAGPGSPPALPSGGGAGAPPGSSAGGGPVAGGNATPTTAVAAVPGTSTTVAGDATTTTSTAPDRDAGAAGRASGSAGDDGGDESAAAAPDLAPGGGGTDAGGSSAASMVGFGAALAALAGAAVLVRRRRAAGSPPEEPAGA